MADDEKAVVLTRTCLVFRTLDLHQSRELLLEKVRWTWPRLYGMPSLENIYTVKHRRQYFAGKVRQL